MFLKQISLSFIRKKKKGKQKFLFSALKQEREDLVEIKDSSNKLHSIPFEETNGREKKKKEKKRKEQKRNEKKKQKSEMEHRAQKKRSSVFNQHNFNNWVHIIYENCNAPRNKEGEEITNSIFAI